MTPEDKLRRGEEAARLLKNEVLAAAFAETVNEIRGEFYKGEFNEQSARAAHAANGSLEALRLKLKLYVAEANGIAARAEADAQAKANQS